MSISPSRHKRDKSKNICSDQQNKKQISRQYKLPKQILEKVDPEAEALGEEVFMTEAQKQEVKVLVTEAVKAKVRADTAAWNTQVKLRLNMKFKYEFD